MVLASIAVRTTRAEELDELVTQGIDSIASHRVTKGRFIGCGEVARKYKKGTVRGRRGGKSFYEAEVVGWRNRSGYLRN